MSENTRVIISSVVKNQLPDFIKADFRLAGDFLAQYYTALEGQGATLDILQNIDKYVKVDELTDLIESTKLSVKVGIADNTITVDSTTGFPESYGLLEIDSEIITYTGITTNTFTGCSRGFSGITSYRDPNVPDELVFTNSGISTHSSGTVVNNLSIRFLEEFFKKVKKQVSPGFEERTLDDDINKRLFLKQSKDFYSSKGTDRSFEILFRALYGEDVNVLKPRDFLFIPSHSDYKISKQIVVESIDGDPEDLINRNLFQDNVDGFPKATGAINNVEKIVRADKTYYRLSLDYAPGSTSPNAEFSIHPNTKLVDPISIESSVLSVDSTVGFGTTGSLIARFADGTSNTIKYTSKSLNQFFGCSGVDINIEATQDIVVDAYAYGYSGVGTANVVKVKVTGVLSNLDTNFEGNYLSEIGDVIEPKGLGSNTDNPIIKTLFSNISTTYDIESIELIDESNFTYKLTLYDNHDFIVGDNALINTIKCSIISLISSKEILMKGAGELSLIANYKIQRLISKANLANYPEANIYTTNVQNSYLNERGNETIIASPSIPNYFNQSLDIRNTDLLFSGVFSDSTEITIENHGLITGEKVTYVGGGSDNELDITEDEYFVKKVDIDTIKLSRSNANISNDNYVSFSGTVSNNKLEISEFAKKSISTQKLLRKIQSPIPTTISHSTQSGKTGILVNGVEILNYKSNDLVYYGPLNEISVLTEGSEYDISNPPIISTSDQTGIGVSAFCEVQGTVERIDVVDGGFDYLTTPTLKITGANGIGCVADVNLVLKDHSVEFNSIKTAGLVDITANTIGFATYHKFRDAELVSYNTEGQTAIAGLTTNATYFCCVKNATTVSLHKNYQDAIVGVSTVDLTNYGAGIHELKCQSKKRIVSSVSIGNSGSGYTNRLTSITSAGINTSINTINIKGHGYKTGEKVRYDTKGTNIIGLATLTDYYVTEVSGDSFRLSAVGVGTTSANFYLKNKKYIDLKSGGSGYHEFNYPPLKVEISGHIGVSTFSGQDFNASLRPVGKGSIKSVYVVDGGQGYGSADIINYNKQPEFTLKSGKNAQLYPIVSDGKITEVLVLHAGTEYNSAPQLKVTGEGKGCIIIPVLNNGSIDSVNVVHSGIGYTSTSAKVEITSNGKEAKFYSNPKTWTINTFERLLQNEQITTDDGVISRGLNSDYQLQYSHLYAPRKLRQSTYVKKSVGDKEVFVADLSLENDIEQDSGTHSPILGWSYDGSPIYGPYGYSTNSGGSLKILQSGYSVSISTDRPNPLTSNGEQIYPDGFFVEDYLFTPDKDLDEHNGRFCKTPEYPNGVYAYFATINPNVKDSEGAFKNYRRPQFPYFIGNSYKHQPIEFNFFIASNQDDIDINDTDLIRNTRPYNFLFKKTTYDFLVNPNDINQQKTFVTDTTEGTIDVVGIVTGGSGYKVRDTLFFDNEKSSGYQANAGVSVIEGKTINQISIANTTFNDVEFISNLDSSSFVGYTTIPHNFYETEWAIISGLNTSGFTNNQPQSVGIKTEKFKLFNEVSGISTTGIVTFFNLVGDLNSFSIRENDVLGIGTEQVKVLNVDPELSRVRVIRQYNSTIGSSHTTNSLVSAKPRTFNFAPITGEDISDYRLNRELYFNPKESVALGNVSGVGIGSTLFFSNPGTGISEIFIPTKSIYIKDHELNSGYALTYRTND